LGIPATPPTGAAPASSAPTGAAPPPPRWFRAGLQTRFLLTFGVIIVGLVTATVVFVVRNQTHSLLEATRDRGLSVARSIAWLSTPSLLSYNYVALGQAAHRSQAAAEILYVIIYDKEGLIAADSREPNAFGQPPRGSSDVAAHAAREERWSYLPAERAGRPRLLEVTVPVYVEGGLVKWGTVRLAMSLAEVDGEITATTRQLVLEGIIAAIFCMIAARFAARSITRPIESLVVATRAVARGDYSLRVNLRSGDEIETLAWHFDRMADEVQRQQGEALASRLELERLNESLEAAVEARTHALAESEAKYRILVESSPLGILIVQAGRAVFVNLAFERMTGRTAADLVSGRADPLAGFHSESQAKLRDAIAGLGDVEGQVPVQIVHASGRRVFAEVQTASLVFQNEPATMVLVSDVSTLRDLQEQLLRGEKLRALGELSAGVAHDFNNILGIILGRAQLLQMRVSDPDVISGLDVIRKAAEDGGQTVRRIQQFSRTREERAQEILALPAIAEEVVEITRGKWKHESERRGTKVEVRIEAHATPPILGSHAEIREALTNLIFNSVDALPDGGTITIRARAEAGEAILEVIDDGVGMSEEVRTRMFEPFFTTKGVSGNGLGLSMVYGIVSRHRGTIEVQSEPLQGTTVQMRFPAASGAGAPRAREERAVAPFRARILVVDDETELLGVIGEALTAGGHEVETASSGSDGIARFRSRPFDAILSDLGMPDVSGWEVARTVRAEGEPSLVLGLVTGWGAMVSDELVSAHGVDFVISKPFQVDELISKVNEALAAHASEIRRGASRSGPHPT
jgi:PAS domain S-box-containing protein